MRFVFRGSLNGCTHWELRLPSVSAPDDHDGARALFAHVRQVRVCHVYDTEEIRIKLLHETLAPVLQVSRAQARRPTAASRTLTYPASSAIPGAPKPALFTTTSTRPQMPTASFATACILSKLSVTSSCKILQFGDSRCLIFSRVRAVAMIRSPRSDAILTRLDPNPADVPMGHTHR